MPVLFPVRSCLQNTCRLLFLRTASEQDNELISVSSEIDPVSGAKIDLIFGDARAQEFLLRPVTA
jgi:hypothetical protein